MEAGLIKTLQTHRHLLIELVRRDIRLRYVGSLLGLFWSVLNPIFQLVLYTLVFSVFLGVRFGTGEDTAGFAEQLFCALLPWGAFHETTTRAARVFLDNANLVKKIRFPLAVLPLSQTISALFHQALGTLIFLLVIALTGSLDLRNAYLLLLLLPTQLVLMLGVSFTVSCVNVFIRDAGQIVGVILMFLFWLTPIVYSRANVGAPYSTLLGLNPLTHMVEGYRSAFFGLDLPGWPGLLFWTAFTLAALFLGLRILHRSRPQLLDQV